MRDFISMLHAQKHLRHAIHDLRIAGLGDALLDAEAALSRVDTEIDRRVAASKAARVAE